MSTKIALEEIPPSLHKKIHTRVMIVGCIVLFTMLLLSARLFQLQIIEHAQYETRSLDNRITTQVIPPARGFIYDRNGVLLATNRIVQSLAILRESVDDTDRIVAAVRSLIEFDSAEESAFRTRLHQASRREHKVIIKHRLTEEQLATLAVNRFEHPGLLTVTETIREYPTSELTAHVVGSVRQVTKNDLQMLDPIRYRLTKYIGKRGVELYFEDHLHGEIGLRTMEVNVHGQELSDILIDPPTRGQSLTLHLDVNLQQVASDALGDRRGAVVALDPSTGGILAMVSKPSYDPNEFVLGWDTDAFNEIASRRDAPLFNRAIQGLYPPGSTFKPIVGLAGLALGLIDWETEIDDPKGEFRIEGVDNVYRDWNWNKNGSGGHGLVDLNRAIYRSSNIFFFHLGVQLDVDSLAAFAGQFGLGRNSSIDIPDAETGILPDSQWKEENLDEKWYLGENMNYVIGQGFLLVTPLQLATVATLFATRGKWVRPRLVKDGDGATDQLNEDFQPIAGVSDLDWENMTKALQDVVHRGYQGYRQNGVAWAHIGMDIPYTMAGKSGTAQVKTVPQGEEYDESELSEYERKHALFWAFAPVDKPRIAVAVVVENGGGGSSIAGPIVRAVIDTYLAQQVVRINE